MLLEEIHLCVGYVKEAMQIYGPLASHLRKSESNLYIRQAQMKLTLAGCFKTLTLLYMCEDKFAIM